MFIHNINPILLDLGFFQIRYYSLVYIIGFLLGYYIIYLAAKKKTIKNLTVEAVDDFMIYLIIFSIIGGRLGHFIFWDITYFWTDPFEILKIWHGGLSIHGGILGAIGGYFLFRRKHKVDFYSLADLAVYPLAFTLFLGKIANFINGELWGTITTVSWCVKFQGAEGCRHPAQLYESLKNLFIFSVLYFTRNKTWKTGTRFWLFILLYGILRTVINFWREDMRWFGLSMGQYLSIIMIFVAIYFLYKLNAKDK